MTESFRADRRTVPLLTLLVTEFWERFSYYGMRAILILFMTAPASTGGLGLPVPYAASLYGMYTTTAYLTSMAGGWLADRYVGHREAVFVGSIVIALGHFLMAMPAEATWYAGLLFICAGTGLLKPNITSQIGQLYTPADPRRDAAFSLFYMGINLGALLAPLVCGTLGQQYSWHLGFGAAGVGMTLGTVIYAWQKSSLPAGAMYKARHVTLFRRCAIGGLVTLLAVVWGWNAFSIAFPVLLVYDVLGWVLLVSVLVVLVMLFQSRQLGDNGLLVVVLLASQTVYWAMEEQAGSSLALFAQNNVNRDAWGSIPASLFASVSPFFIVLLSPLFALIWRRYGHTDQRSLLRTAAAMAMVGSSFLLLAFASFGTRKVSPWWLVAAYFLQTLGELSLMPVNLSAMSRYAPASMVGLMMGTLLVFGSFGNYLGGRVARLYGAVSLPTMFGGVATTAFVVAAVILVLHAVLKQRGATPAGAGVTRG